MICKNCRETMVGDGYSIVLHCPNTEETTVEYVEPDANPVYCTTDTTTQETNT